MEMLHEKGGGVSVIGIERTEDRCIHFGLAPANVQ